MIRTREHRLPVLGADRPDASEDRFSAVLRDHSLAPLRRDKITTLQVNLGKLCNQACHHCHVEAGPKRTEIMPRHVAERVIELLERNPGVTRVDLTGGAPELNPHFRWLVAEARRLGRAVIDRCNLTVLFEPGMDDLAEFLAANAVRVVASLPCYTAENVEKQRGHGVFRKSIEGLELLNALGYGRASGLPLDLVYNPIGPFLPPAQEKLEAKYKEELSRLFDIEFNALLTITNMPIRRFAHALERSGQHEAYMGLLVNHFNPSTVGELMCRSLISVGWDGRLFDCDFNQMLELPLGAGERTVWDIDRLDAVAGARITVASHCLGCTAGAGSSCSGALQSSSLSRAAGDLAEAG
jgi:radical SAM/Cys-rich protein